MARQSTFIPRDGSRVLLLPSITPRHITIINLTSAIATVTDNSGQLYRTLPGATISRPISQAQQYEASLDRAVPDGTCEVVISDEIGASSESTPSVMPGSAWYDFYRNPVPLHFEYSGFGVGPHGVTERINYTVPANRSLFIASHYLYVERITAPGVYNVVAMTLRAGTVAGTRAIAEAKIRLSTEIKDKVHATASALLLTAGETLKADSVDVQTGGTNDLFAWVHAVEFDS